MKMGIFKLLIILSAIFASQFGEASDVDVEKDLQEKLKRSRVLIEKVAEKIRAGDSAQEEIAALTALSENIKLSHLMLRKKFSVVF